MKKERRKEKEEEAGENWMEERRVRRRRSVVCQSSRSLQPKKTVFMRCETVIVARFPRLERASVRRCDCICHNKRHVCAADVTSPLASFSIVLASLPFRMKYSFDPICLCFFLVSLSPTLLYSFSFSSIEKKSEYEKKFVYVSGVSVDLS